MKLMSVEECDEASVRSYYGGLSSIDKLTHQAKLLAMMEEVVGSDRQSSLIQWSFDELVAEAAMRIDQKEA